MLQQSLFIIMAALVLLTAGLVAFRPRPIESAMWLILNFFFTAGLYVLLGSHFVAVIQILVYAGAIMVLFVFVILLLNLDPKELGDETSLHWSSVVMFVGMLSFLLLILHVAGPQTLEPMEGLLPDSKFGSVEALAQKLLTDYVWGFELAGVILLLAIVGVGMLAYRKPKPKTPKFLDHQERPV